MRYMLLLTVMVCGWPMLLMGADAAPVVGSVTIEMDNRTISRRALSELWFEAAADAKSEPFAAQPLFRSIPLARGASPASGVGKRPLIVISHGNFGSRFSHAWLAVELVKSGYVVLSTSHPGTMGEDQSPAGRYRLWDRSRDVSFAIDELLKHPRWSALIDESRIGFAGHSFGGWTGVSLAGGRYDPAQQRTFCENVPQKDFYCGGTLRDDIAAVPAKDAGESFKDPRMRAFYIMGAGPAQGFSAESLAAIRAPFLIDTAQYDTVLEPRANSAALAKQIPGAKEVVRPVGHFVYAPECLSRPPASAGVVSVICSDPDGIDRALIHRQVAHDMVEFFDEHLRKR